MQINLDTTLSELIVSKQSVNTLCDELLLEFTGWNNFWWKSGKVWHVDMHPLGAVSKGFVKYPKEQQQSNLRPYPDLTTVYNDTFKKGYYRVGFHLYNKSAFVNHPRVTEQKAIDILWDCLQYLRDKRKGNATGMRELEPKTYSVLMDNGRSNRSFNMLL